MTGNEGLVGISLFVGGETTPSRTRASMACLSPAPSMRVVFSVVASTFFKRPRGHGIPCRDGATPCAAEA